MSRRKIVQQEFSCLSRWESQNFGLVLSIVCLRLLGLSKNGFGWGEGTNESVPWIQAILGRTHMGRECGGGHQAGFLWSGRGPDEMKYLACAVGHIVACGQGTNGREGDKVCI